MKITQLKFILLTLVLFALVNYVNTSKAQTNLLNNAGFELPYQANGEANSWGRWHENSTEDKFGDCTNGYHKQPQWSAETNGALVHSGGASQHVGMQWDTWHAGVFQTVSVTPGSTYRFTVWAYSHGGSKGVFDGSDGDMNSQVQVGIDPNGSGLWYEGDVVWSGKINPLDGWQQVSVEATATGDKVSVYTSANWGIPGANQCRAHIDTWFDSAELVEVGPPPTSTPVPQPTSPPPPPATSTPIPQATATTAAEPTAAPTEEIAQVEPTAEPTAEMVSGGTICVNAFADTNGNGVKDADEGYMGNVTFTVAQGTQAIGQAISTGTPNPVCFEGLAAGDYQIAQTVPDPLEMTTASNATLTVADGQTIGIEFGSRIRTDEGTTEDATDGTTEGEPTAEPENGDGDSESNPLLAFSGIFMLIVGFLLLGGIVLVVLSRRGN